MSQPREERAWTTHRVLDINVYSPQAAGPSSRMGQHCHSPTVRRGQLRDAQAIPWRPHGARGLGPLLSLALPEAGRSTGYTERAQ